MLLAVLVIAGTWLVVTSVLGYVFTRALADRADEPAADRVSGRDGHRGRR